MKVINRGPATGRQERGGRATTLAFFDLELSDDVKLYGLRLVEFNGRKLTYIPSANGGRRCASFSPTFIDRVTAAAVSIFEGHKTADGICTKAS